MKNMPAQTNQAAVPRRLPQGILSLRRPSTNVIIRSNMLVVPPKEDPEEISLLTEDENDSVSTQRSTQPIQNAFTGEPSSSSGLSSAPQSTQLEQHDESSQDSIATMVEERPMMLPRDPRLRRDMETAGSSKTTATLSEPGASHSDAKETIVPQPGPSTRQERIVRGVGKGKSIINLKEVMQTSPSQSSSDEEEMDAINIIAQAVDYMSDFKRRTKKRLERKRPRIEKTLNDAEAELEALNARRRRLEQQVAECRAQLAEIETFCST